MSAQRKQVKEPLQFKAKVFLITGEDEHIAASAEARDITPKGLHLRPQKKIPLNTRCTVDITLTGTASTIHVVTPATVCAHDVQGMDVTFTDMDIISFVHLNAFISVQGSRSDVPS